MTKAAVVILYKPTEKYINNILTYNNFFDKIYIIDNSFEDNSNLVSKINNGMYVSNKKNLGIAKALNIGCQLAFKDGFEWCMTMDQDSFWKIEDLENYFKYIKNNIYDKKNISFAPNTERTDEKLSIYSELKRKVFKIKNNELINNKKNNTENVLKVICSGNFFNLSIWNDIGKFNEDLFIDEVDFDFCYRLKRNNFNIIQFNFIKLNHNYGDNIKTIFPKLIKHDGYRIYYIIRNMLITKKNYPEYTENYNKILKRYFIDCCILNLHFVKNFYLFVKAFIDYKKYVKGNRCENFNCYGNI